MYEYVFDGWVLEFCGVDEFVGVGGFVDVCIGVFELFGFGYFVGDEVADHE